MSPDARLIASALLFAATANDPEYTVERIASHVEAMEDALATQFPDSDRGIRGMVPVALVRDWLRDIHAKVLGAEAGQEAIAVESITWKYTQELAQFSGDA